MKYTQGKWEVSRRIDEGYRVHTVSGGRADAIADLDEWQTKEETEANANLIAAAPGLLEEHKQWAKILGHIIVRALQGDYEALDTYAKCIPIEFVNGEPWAKSEAIAKAEGR